MKIMMVSDMYPPLIGGMEREIQLLSEGLAQRTDCEVIVCTLRHDLLPDFEETNRLKIYRLTGLFQRLPALYRDRTKEYHPPMPDWVLTRKIGKILTDEKPDIVHTHNWMLYSLLPLRKKHKFSWCASFHDFGYICPRRWSSSHAKGICDKPLSSACIACGRAEYNFAKSFLAYLGLLANKNFAPKTIVFSNPNIVENMRHLKSRKIYLEHPIDTDRYKPVNLGQYNARVLVWAKLARIKGMDLVYSVANELKEYTFDIPFIGDDKEYYLKLKPSNVNLISPIPSATIPLIINRYPIVLGQLHIGVFGHAELEAMSCGKPVVSYWDRQYDRLYSDPCPILTSHKVKQITELVRNNLGNEEIGKMSRSWIMKYHSVHCVVNKLFNIYKEMLETAD